MGKLLGIKQLCNLVQSLKVLFVKKIGDTMSGALNWTQSGQTLNVIQNTDLDMRANTTPLETTESIGGYQWRDANGELVGYIEVKRAVDTNNTYLQCNLRRYSSDGSSMINHGFSLQLDDNLDPVVTFTTPEARSAWRYALGFGFATSVGDRFTIDQTGTGTAETTIYSIGNLNIKKGSYLVIFTIPLTTSGTTSVAKAYIGSTELANVSTNVPSSANVANSTTVPNIVNIPNDITALLTIKCRGQEAATTWKVKAYNPFRVCLVKIN